MKLSFKRTVGFSLPLTFYNFNSEVMLHFDGFTSINHVITPQLLIGVKINEPIFEP